MYRLDLALTPKAPFDFEQSLAFIGMFGPTAADQSRENQRLRKAMQLADQTLIFDVRSDGTVEAPLLRVHVWSEAKLSNTLQEEIVDQIGFYLSVEDDLAPFYDLAKQDPGFAPVLKSLYGYHQVKFPTPFESAIWAILSQRTPQAVAGSQKEALMEAVGNCLSLEGETYWAFPTPAQVAELDDNTLGDIVRNSRKADYVRNVAAAFSSVDPTFLHEAPDEEVEDWLLNITGIGAWSASLVMIRGLGRMNRLELMQPMVNVASEYYANPKARKLTKGEVADLAGRYGEWQGYWMHYLRAARR